MPDRNLLWIGAAAGCAALMVGRLIIKSIEHSTLKQALDKLQVRRWLSQHNAEHAQCSVELFLMLNPCTLRKRTHSSQNQGMESARGEPRQRY